MQNQGFKLSSNVPGDRSISLIEVLRTMRDPTKLCFHAFPLQLTEAHGDYDILMWVQELQCGHPVVQFGLEIKFCKQCARMFEEVTLVRALLGLRGLNPIGSRCC